MLVINIKPTNDNLVVKKLISKQKEESSLHLLDNAQDFNEAYKGEVISVGPGRKTPEGYRWDMSVEPGHTIFYKQYMGHKIEETDDDSGNYYLLSEKDVLGILDE